MFKYLFILFNNNINDKKINNYQEVIIYYLCLYLLVKTNF